MQGVPQTIDQLSELSSEAYDDPPVMKKSMTGAPTKAFETIENLKDSIDSSEN
jgi:hypothetical protein